MQKQELQKWEEMLVPFMTWSEGAWFCCWKLDQFGEWRWHPLHCSLPIKDHEVQHLRLNWRESWRSMRRLLDTEYWVLGFLCKSINNGGQSCFVAYNMGAFFREIEHRKQHFCFLLLGRVFWLHRIHGILHIQNHSTSKFWTWIRLTVSPISNTKGDHSRDNIQTVSIWPELLAWKSTPQPPAFWRLLSYS